MIVYAGPVLQPQDDVAHSLIFYSHRRVTTVVGADQLKAAVPCGHSSDTVLDTAVVPTLPAGYTWTEKAGWFRFGLGKIDARC
jgi:hypothetical protein